MDKKVAPHNTCRFIRRSPIRKRNQTSRCWFDSTYMHPNCNLSHLLVLLPNYTSYRFIAWRVYHQRLASSSVVYRSVALSRHRSVALPTLSLYRLIAPPLGRRGGALPRTAPLLRRSITLSLHDAVTLSAHRSVAPPLGCSAARSLGRSTAPSLCCQGGALLRAALLQGPERAERKAVHAEQRLQSRDQRVQSTD